MKKLLFFILVFSIHLAAQAADEFSTVEERMSGKEFKETGLGKLTDESLPLLMTGCDVIRWLRWRMHQHVRPPALPLPQPGLMGQRTCGALKVSQKVTRKIM